MLTQSLLAHAFFNLALKIVVEKMNPEKLQWKKLFGENREFRINKMDFIEI